jgi:3-dehydroquinate dehydratase-2
LGKREPDVYGSRTLQDVIQSLKNSFVDIEIDHFQSNVEGELINRLQETEDGYDGVVLNAGGYTHTSVSLRDAIAAIKTPVVEVHMSNTAAREEFRYISLVSGVCVGSITGFGEHSYWLGVNALKNHLSQDR